MKLVCEKRVKLVHWNKTAEVTKGDVSQVYYIREAPLSAGAEYAAQEMVFFDPELWPYMLHIPPRIPVLLYDSSLPEDDTPVECKTRVPWR